MAGVLYGADVELVRALAVYSNSLPDADVDGNTALHFAASDGKVDVIEALLQRPSAIEFALRHRFLAAADAGAGAGVGDLKRPPGGSEQRAEETLEEAVARHRHEVQVLLESRNALLETPLYCAVKACRVEATQRLLQCGADPRVPVCYVALYFKDNINLTSTVHSLEVDY